MSMRITQGMITDRLVSSLGTTQSRLATLQEQAASGNRITKPSDDALGTHDALRRRDELGQLSVFKGAADDATGWLETTDSTLQNVTDLIHRARELAVQAATGSASPASRQSIATELASIIDAVKDSANARYGDQYIFAGQDTTTAPYTSGATDTYAGDAGVIARQIGPNSSVQVNTPGSAIFGAGGGDGKLIDVLRTIQTHLAANNQAGLGTDLTALDGQLNVVTAARATVGAAQNRVDAALDRTAQATETATRLLGDTESVDLAEVLTKLSMEQSAYTAALKTGATVIQTSLLDFLR
jgi:flagellar hook-associated protein 3 FlgL